MKKNILLLFATVLISSCGSYTNIYKVSNQDFRYEAAKEYFAMGQYTKASSLLNELITILKGSSKGEESVYMLAMSYYNDRDYTTAAETFKQYYSVYPRGVYVERARYFAGKALYLNAPEYRLDQSGTYSAIQELQVFLELFPDSQYKETAQNMVFEMQDKLVEKELGAAKLYFNLGTYLGNNFQSCVITAQNALKDYPYTKYREDLSLLVMKAKHELAVNSVSERRADRYREAVDECYAFKNEFPDSKNVKYADEMISEAEKFLGTETKEEE